MIKKLLILILLLSSFVYAKDKDIKEKDDDIVVGDEGTEIEGINYIEYNIEADATTKLEDIDKALGYLVDDGEGGFYRPFSTLTAFNKIKHPTEDKWAIEIEAVDGTKYKIKDTVIFVKEEKDKFKDKDVMDSAGWFPEE